MNKTGQIPSRNARPAHATARRRRTPAGTAVLAAMIAGAAVSLGGCMTTYPPTPRTVLSQLPEQRNAAAPTLSPEEKKRYDEIDKRVLREQDEAMRAEAAARAWPYYSYAPVYGSYYSGGWGHGWSAGGAWGYPAYYPGWWW